MGLFATKNIKKGSIVSFYPVDCIGIEDVLKCEESGVDEMLTTTTIVRSRRRLLEIEDETNERDIMAEGCINNNGNDQAYLLHIVGNRPLMKMDVMKGLGGSLIFINVDDDDDAFGSDGDGGGGDGNSLVGFDSHRVNDGATVLSNTEHGALSYYQASRAVANCVHVPFGPSPLVATVTTRKIKKGEELLTTYGCSCKFL